MNSDKIAKFTKIISFRYDCINNKIIIICNRIKSIKFKLKKFDSTASALQYAKSSSKNNKALKCIDDV